MISTNCKVVCPSCGSSNVEDHNEFGLPLWFRFRCLNCGLLFGKLEKEIGVKK